MGRYIKRVIIWLLEALLVVFILSLVIIPMYHKSPTGVEWEKYRQSSQEQADNENNTKVICVDDNVEALIWRLRLIEGAQKSILLASFDFADDNSGIDVMSALYAAADRGVDIKLIIDGFCGSKDLNFSDEFRALGAKENIEIKFYNPLNLLKPWTINYRLHDKYIIVDDAVFILGGRNTSDLFLGDYQQKQNMDRELVVYTDLENSFPALKQLEDYFCNVWTLPCSKNFTRSKSDDNINENFKIRYEQLHTLYPSAFDDGAVWDDVAFNVHSVALLSNPVNVGNKTPELWNSLVKLMGKGDKVLIQTPYLICSEQMYGDLLSTGRDTQISVLTNSVATGANPWGCSDYIVEKEKILSYDIDMYEYAHLHSMHTKTILIDDNISIIGSFNMDMRSAYLDTELMLVVDSEELSDYLYQDLQPYINHSKLSMHDGGESLGKDYSGIPMPVVRRIFYPFLGRLIRPFRHLL